MFKGKRDSIDTLPVAQLYSKAHNDLENGDYAAAFALAHRSLAMIPDNAAAIHVIAHVFEMQGRAADGIRFLEQTRPTWSMNPGFAAHIAWHLALFHVDRGSASDALEIHDAMLRPTRSSAVATLVDASALLWRLELRGTDVGRRFRAVARVWRRQPLRRLRAPSRVDVRVAPRGSRRHAPVPGAFRRRGVCPSRAPELTRAHRADHPGRTHPGSDAASPRRR